MFKSCRLFKQAVTLMFTKTDHLRFLRPEGFPRHQVQTCLVGHVAGELECDLQIH